MFENFGLFFPVIVRGLLPTVYATVGGIALTIVLSLLSGFMLLSRSRAVRFVARTYVELLRGTSELVQLFWIALVLPVLIGFEIVPLWAGILVLGLNHGAYGAEIVRGAVTSVPVAQVEGAIALNFTPAQRMRRVVLPQAAVEMVPPFNNLFVQLLKNTALLSFIGVAELNRQVEILRPRFGSQLATMYLIILFLYLGLALLITWGMRALERRLGRRVGRTAPDRSESLGTATAGGI